MSRLITILLLLNCINVFSQLKIGTYSQLDTSLCADFKLFKNNKFEFYDTRESSCFKWAKYDGEWKISQDTLKLSWDISEKENPDTVISIKNLKNKSIEITFLFDNGKPISNLEIRQSCLFDLETQKTFQTDNRGKINFEYRNKEDSTKNSCHKNDRILWYNITDSSNFISSSFSLDYHNQDEKNELTVIVKTEPKIYIRKATKHFLIVKDCLYEIEQSENYVMKWNNFKFNSKKYGRQH